MYLSNVKTKSWLSSRGMILEYTCIKLMCICNTFKISKTNYPQSIWPQYIPSKYGNFHTHRVTKLISFSLITFQNSFNRRTADFNNLQQVFNIV